MISILIPIYNFDATDLFEKLSEELKLIEEGIEVIVFDDHSSLFVDENRTTAKKLKFEYTYLLKNIGRSRIRNRLAKSAKNDFLLFLDGDIIPKSNKFIQNYLDQISTNTEVIYGGRIHEFKKEHQNKLRWKYGHYKEDRTVNQRRKKPYLSLVTNNLLIKKSLFKSIEFEESISSYGHEDTMLAIQLRKRKCNCIHIQNPVIHKDIDENDVFLKKTESALNNLKVIQDSYKLPIREIKILKIFNLIKSLRLIFIINLFFKKIESKLRNHLIENGGNLFLFDVYKLGYFIKINQS